MSQSTANSEESLVESEEAIEATVLTRPNTDEVEIIDCTFIHPVRLDRSTAHNIWNGTISIGTRMFIDFGGLPKLVLRGESSLHAIRYIPWHCVKDFTIK